MATNLHNLSYSGYVKWNKNQKQDAVLQVRDKKKKEIV